MNVSGSVLANYWRKRPVTITTVLTPRSTTCLNYVNRKQRSATTESVPATITRQQWKWSALAGMASYLDAGSIVALGAGMALFQKQFGLSPGAIGLLAAIGPNAIGCALGAFLGGWLGDKLGRKKIYQYDLMVYAFGILLIALSVNTAMLFIGTFIVGVAVGADVPTSLALVGEFAPAKARGKLLGFTQVAWCLGPVIVLWLALALARAGFARHPDRLPAFVRRGDCDVGVAAGTGGIRAMERGSEIRAQRHGRAFFRQKPARARVDRDHLSVLESRRRHCGNFQSLYFQER